MNTASSLFVSPLRYPGGKRKLTNFIKLIFHKNNLLDGDYVEPYAGGASIALSLLFHEYVRRIFINDIDLSVYAFWHSVLNDTDNLCEKIRNTKITIDEWHVQKKIQGDVNATILERGFSTFFLNRTNRSGIISAGVIGGKGQTGKWKLDARFNKEDLIGRIQKVARYRSRIHLYHLDAIDFLTTVSSQIKAGSLIYLDPPYYIKGQQQLYTNFYKPEDHVKVAERVKGLGQKWIVSYDNEPAISKLYEGFQSVTYDIHYNAQMRYRGDEVMFFSNGLEIPEVDNPSTVKNDPFQLKLI